MILLMNVDKDNPSVAEGESVQIQGAGITGFEPKGNTEQDGEPTPDVPVDVKVVTGDNTIKVTGKNLAKSYVNGETLNRYQLSLYVDADFEVGKKYAISFVDKSVGNSYYRNEHLMQNVPSFSITSTGERQTYYFECKSNDKTDSRVYEEGKGFNIFKNNAVLEQLPQFEDIQIEEVTSYDIPSTPYEPYQSQTYSLNLGDIELCKIGDYQDYIYKENNKWYKHSEIGKVVLDGNEDWSRGNPTHRYFTTISGQTNLNIIPMSNYFVGYANSIPSNVNGILLQHADTSTIRINIYNLNFIDNLAGFKDWLSTNTPIVYYVLATPTNTEITDTELKEDLEAISNIALFEGVNNISMESSNLTSSFKVYYDTWYEFDKILRNGYNIREDRDRITQKFANGHRKQFVSDYVDCSITLNLDTIDKDTTQDYLQRLKSGAYKYYSIDGKEYRTAQFIIENKPELSVENSISNNVDVNEYQITLLKAGD